MGIRNTDNSDEAEAFFNKGARALTERETLRQAAEALDAARVALKALSPSRQTFTQRRLLETALKKIDSSAAALAALGEGG